MRKALAVFVLVVVAGAVAVAQTRPVLHGVWKPDPTKGSMRMVPLDRRLTVAQNGNEIVFAEGSLGDPARAKTMRYRVGGESENTYLPGRTEKSTAAWDEGRLVIKGERQMGADAHLAPFTLTVSVSPDGSELQMEERLDTGSTIFTSVRVFTREK
jgi:hypothetical protein